jgi:c-di-GMP-binding flagellar brake protein YcgR
MISHAIVKEVGAMFEEKRIFPRVDTHISTGMILPDSEQQQFGYIENISEDGIGIVSLAYIRPGTRISAGFFLPDRDDKISTTATVIHIQKNMGMVYYYGFQFEYLRESDRELLREFVYKNLRKTGTDA